MNKTAIRVFENKELGKVRIVMIDNETWWVLADICKILEISHIKDTADRLDKDEVGQTEVIDRLGRKQVATIINESGLYSVVLRSDKPQAKPFRKWVTHDVLPSIRKTGGYVVNGKETAFMNNPDSPLSSYITALSQSIEILQSQIMMLQNNSQQPNYWLWKNHVATPAVSNLAEKLNIDMRAAYDLIYDQMFITYGFDRSFAMSQFCTKYCVDNASIIDCVADSPIYQQNFISIISKLSDNILFADNSEKIPVFKLDDNYDFVINILAAKSHQTIALITRRIYTEMNTKLGWKNIMTRRHCNNKKAVIENCKDYKKKFIDICNRMAGEINEQSVRSALA